LPRGSCSLW